MQDMHVGDSSYFEACSDNDRNTQSQTRMGALGIRGGDGQSGARAKGVGTH